MEQTTAKEAFGLCIGAGVPVGSLAQNSFNLFLFVSCIYNLFGFRHRDAFQQSSGLGKFVAAGLNKVFVSLFTVNISPSGWRYLGLKPYTVYVNQFLIWHLGLEILYKISGAI